MKLDCVLTAVNDNLLSQHSHYSNLIFTKSQLNSPVGDGLFDIFINTKENILYKKIKNTDMINIDKYKQIIYGVNSNVVLGEYICEPEKIYIENDGSYYSSYIKNGIRLYDVSKVLKLDYTILNNLKKSIQDMKEKLNNYVKTSKLSGDWALHNLIYCLDTNKIYNIDLEGFYTYPLIHDNGNCDIKYCNECFDKLLDILNKIIAKYDYKYFTLILWNPTLFQSEIILEDIPNIIEKKEIVIPTESLHNYIFDIYKLDTRCSHNIVLPPKIQKLKEYDNKHLIVKFKIDEPQYTNNICNQAVQLKEMIREKYKLHIKNYIKDIMIHVADNFEQSKYIWEKNIKTREDSYNHILDIIRYVKDSGKAYSAKHIDIGYHSIKIDGIYHKGQRDCIKRLEFCKEEYDFTNKNILDVGCCIGGMLFPLSSEINYGCGIDFNYRNINAGNAIKQYTKTDNLSFYIFDLDKEELQFIKNFITQIDVVFLYSVCMWIKKWKGLIDFISLNSKVLFIETNGSQFQQLEQINYCKLKFKIIKQIYDKSLDDKGQHNRKLYICKND